MTKGTSHRHRELRDGNLPRRWLRRHERAEIPDVADDPGDGFDDGCCPYPWCQNCEWHWLSFELWRAWQDMQTVGFASSLGVPGAWVGSVWSGEPPPDTSVVFGDDVAAALHQHIRLVASRAGRAAYAASTPYVAALDQLRPMLRRCPGLLEWFEGFEGCSGAGIMTILLAPFWIRPLETWAAPDSDDRAALGRSLINHLLVRYPVPEALYQPWEREVVPSLKWVSWLVLIGRGASVPRAGSRFGWAVSSKRLAQLHAAPSGLMPVEALIWAEVKLAGGSELEFDRLRQHPGYLFDPTATAARTRFRLESDLEDDGVDSAPSRRFLQATVGWLVRHRADLIYPFPTDRILNWALHRHTEDLARDVPERKRFSWRGRTPVSARDAALEYARQLEEAQKRARDLSWRPRGWDWELPEGVGTVRELTSSTELALESQAMQHCVASYDDRCARGASAIFSLSFAEARQVTVEVEPRSQRIVQARGVQNRGAEPRELDVLQRWLDSLADARRKPKP
jgi:hypothetical protein